VCKEFVTAGWALCTWLHGPSESQADIDVYVDGRKNDIHVDMRRLAITAEHSWLRGMKVRIVMDSARDGLTTKGCPKGKGRLPRAQTEL